LILVLDGADPDHEAKLAAVEKALGDLGLSATPRLLAVNKCDLLPAGQGELLARRLGGVAIAAAKKAGLDDLLALLEQRLWQKDSGSAKGAPRVDLLPEPEAIGTGPGTGPGPGASRVAL
jgi:50S ribosomal subunit-associated GTPase HflX